MTGRYNEWCGSCGRASWGAPTCHQCTPFDPEVAAAFNRRVEAKAAAGDPDALALVAAFSSSNPQR